MTPVSTHDWHQCKRKNQCVLAWPEGCPYFSKGKCPKVTT